MKSIEELLTQAQLLAPTESVAEALSKMGQAGLQYGVVKDPGGQLLGVVSSETLKSKDKQLKLNAIFEGGPPPITVSLRPALEKLEQGLAAHFMTHPELEGIISEEEPPRVLSRTKILEHALEIVSFRGVDRLEGSPLDIVFYECSIDHERKIVEYYTGQAPLCSAGHTMHLVET